MLRMQKKCCKIFFENFFSGDAKLVFCLIDEGVIDLRLRFVIFYAAE
jgi:hypothetical protein